MGIEITRLLPIGHISDRYGNNYLCFFEGKECIQLVDWFINIPLIVFDIESL
jgi:hypothetical protein